MTGRSIAVYDGSMAIYSIYSAENISAIIASLMRGRRILLGKLKLFENILKAASALIASAMSIVKFIGIIGKMKPALAFV